MEKAKEEDRQFHSRIAGVKQKEGNSLSQAGFSEESNEAGDQALPETS